MNTTHVIFFMGPMEEKKIEGTQGDTLPLPRKGNRYFLLAGGNNTASIT
jgi:hypothetical protein